MSNARIIEIPATRQIRSGKNNTMRKMRVAAYCRVSTEEEEQQGSFETQKLYYTEKINSTSEWELAGIYADDGISGIHTKKRDGFNQMIQDCKKKKIDLILTKSISRFARNTLDSIQYVRMLKAIGIAVIFEKENINTSTMNSEMILTVLSAFAQAESESISQNVARGKRMGFRQGKFPFPYGQILGYRKGLDGKPEVIPEEAEVIRMIFNSYLQGASLLTIKKKLEAGGVLTARGNKKWSSESVQRILQNEKYCGDVLLQKTFIEDVLTGVSKKNTGQLPQYYIENNHEGIVTKQMFREVQAEIARRNSKSAANQRKRHQGRYNSKYALSERLVCGDCGSPYKRVTWNIHGRKQIVWRCVNRLEYGTKFCSHSPSIPEEELHQAILKAVQNLAANFTDEDADLWDRIQKREPNAYLVLLYWDSEMFRRSTKKRRDLEAGTEKKDYKALCKDILFLHPEKYTIAKDTKAHLDMWRGMFIKTYGIAMDKHYKTMYEGLLYGDPKMRVLRILWTEIYNDHNMMIKEAQRGKQFLRKRQRDRYRDLCREENSLVSLQRNDPQDSEIRYEPPCACRYQKRDENGAPRHHGAGAHFQGYIAVPH